MNDELPNSITIATDPINILEKNKIDQYHEDKKAYEYVISPYFNSYKEKESRNFSERKLINILEDVHINIDEVYNIVKKVNPENLRKINEISVDVTESLREKQKIIKVTILYILFLLGIPLRLVYFAQLLRALSDFYRMRP